MTRRAYVRYFAWILAGTLLLSACTNDTETNPGTSEAPPPDATTTTSSEPDTTTTTATPGIATEARTEFGILITYENSIAIRQPEGETTVLEGDFETPLLAAYDDLNGGIVYQYEQTSANLGQAILHMTPTSQPTEVVRADPGRVIQLMDVGSYQERTQILYVDTAVSGAEGKLMVAGLSGGAAELVTTLDGIVSASLSDDRVAISQFDGTCNSAQILDEDAQILHDCAPAALDLRIDGQQFAYLSDGIIEASEEVNWSSDLRATTQLFDFEEDVAAVRNGATGFKLLDTNGASFNFRTNQVVQFVSILRSEVNLGEGLFLGGIRTPSGSCSAVGLPASPLTQSTLPAPVAEARSAIVEAATECNFTALERLAGPDFFYTFDATSGADLSRFWQQSDQQNFDTLAVLVRTLDLPFAESTGVDETVVYVWPAVAEIENPTEADWQALSAVYNEEEIEFYKNFGGFIGWRIYISADGTWIGAIAGD